MRNILECFLGDMTAGSECPRPIFEKEFCFHRAALIQAWADAPYVSALGQVPLWTSASLALEWGQWLWPFGLDGGLAMACAGVGT